MKKKNKKKLDELFNIIATKRKEYDSCLDWMKYKEKEAKNNDDHKAFSYYYGTIKSIESFIDNLDYMANFLKEWKSR